MCIVYSAYAPNNWCIIFKYCLFNGAIICLILICSVRNCYGSFNRYVCIVIINHMNLLNYVPYAHPVLGASCPTCLMPYVLSCLTCLVAYMLSRPTCSLALRASYSTCFPSLCASCPLYLVSYVLSCPTLPRAVCAPVFHVPRAPRAGREDQ